MKYTFSTENCTTTLVHEHESNIITLITSYLIKLIKQYEYIPLILFPYSCITYEDSPDECSNDDDCQNPTTLFCDFGECKPKIVEGANCSGLPDRACYVPREKRDEGGFIGRCSFEEGRCEVVNQD